MLSPSLSTRGGGIYEFIRNLSANLHENNIEVLAAGVDDETWEEDSAGWYPIDARCFRNDYMKFFRYSSDLRKYCKSVQGDCDLAHLSFLWLHTSLIAKDWAKRKPLIVTPHGMLEKWALKNNRWKKVIANFVYERSMLSHAKCLHATTYKELQDLRDYGLKTPIAVIPNGVNLPDCSVRNQSSKEMLFLGRLHPKKGLSELFTAWSQLTEDELRGWKLVIAGWGDPNHEKMFREQVSRLKLEKTVKFEGPVFNEQKDELLRRSSAFILPSFSEGLPLSVLEAWSYRLPIIMTPQCNFPEGFDINAAIKIAPEPESILQGIRELIMTDDTELDAIGNRGRELVESSFSWPEVTRQIIQMYQWSLGQIDQPTFIHKS